MVLIAASSARSIANRENARLGTGEQNSSSKRYTAPQYIDEPLSAGVQTGPKPQAERMHPGTEAPGLLHRLGDDDACLPTKHSQAHGPSGPPPPTSTVTYYPRPQAGACCAGNAPSSLRVSFPLHQNQRTTKTWKPKAHMRQCWLRWAPSRTSISTSPLSPRYPTSENA